MDFFRKFFGLGTNNSLTFYNNGGFTHSGPWKLIGRSNSFDRWYIGEVCAAEYTILIDESTENKEIIKCMVVASTEIANLQVFGRSALNRELVKLEATVNRSYVDVTITPVNKKIETAKFIYSANYFKTLSPISF